ncbi:restriction endonuclease subunit S [Microbacterium paraoxydans]|uniref:restriction endonuclease subunit S n=1 Tax=Microbacterium paraoxydans TaxID=199592 RepID=UPI001CF98048|nr:restriction endonuclease subunit S [Microbacterium paraoxydans]
MSRIYELIQEHCPDGVRFAPIGEVAQVNAGATPSKSVAGYWTGGTIPWLSSGEVNKGTIYEADTLITQAGYDSCSTKMIPAGAVVIALAGQGKTRGMVARTRLSCCTNQSLASIVPNDDLDSDFLYYFLQTQYSRLRDVSSGGGSRGGLNLVMIRAYRVPVPPLDVQREVVRVLDQFTQLEAELETELEARRQQYSYYRDALVGAVDGKAVSMGEIGKFIRGRRFTKNDVVEEGIPSIHYGEIYTDYGVSASRANREVRSDMAGQLRYAQPLDVIFAGVGETVEDVGKAVAWLGDGPVAVHDDTFSFTSNLDPKYVAYAVQTQDFHAQKANYVARGKVKRLSSAGLAKITIPVPSVPGQKRIVALLDRFDALVNDLSLGLPAELAARRKQYEHYRDKLLTFEEDSA